MIQIPLLQIPLSIEQDGLVSWQSILCALVPIMLSAMTQPSGTVLAFPSTLRTYVRSSPIICLFDGIYGLIHFVVCLCRDGTLRQAARIDASTDAPHGLQVIEKSGPLRALLFLLCTIQATKLACCTGIPWTQTWAACYVIPYLFRELLSVCENHLPSSEKDSPTLNEKRWLNRISLWFTVLAISLQLALITWANDGISHVILGQLEHREPGPIPEVALALFLCVLVTGTGGVTALVAVRVLATSLELSAPIHAALSFGMFVGAVGTTIWRLCLESPYLIGGVVPTAALPYLELLLLVVMMGLLFRVGFLRQHLFLYEERIRIGSSALDEWSTIGVCTVFVVVIGHSCLWYAYCYDPEGTGKPGWTNLLG